MFKQLYIDPTAVYLKSDTDAKTGYMIVKRIIDILAVLLSAVLWIPLFVAVAAAVKLTSAGPALFKQTRVGKDGAHFTIYKFRSMYVDAPSDVPTHLLEDANALITPLGHYIRKYCLDELPQLLNVLKGELTLVGPRPALPSQTDLLRLRIQSGADTLVPGMTGLAQITGRDAISIKAKAAYDGAYYQRMRLYYDFSILAWTVFVLFHGHGFVEGKQAKTMASQSAQAAIAATQEPTCKGHASQNRKSKSKSKKK